MTCVGSRVAAARGAGVAVGGQHQLGEGGGAAASLVFLPALGESLFVHKFSSCTTFSHVDWLTGPLSSQ